MKTENLEIGICDDSPEDLERIRQAFLKSAGILGDKVSLYLYSNGRSLYHDSRNRKFSLVFLDWEMPEMDGFNLAGELHAADPSIKIVFVSNHENMVFDSYEYAPLWFVRKSSLERDMPKAVQKYFRTTEFQTADRVRIRCRAEEGMRELWVSVSEVLYVEGSGHTLLMKMSDRGCYQLYGSLKMLEEQLSAYGFVRVHKNFLVNAKYVKEIGSRTVCLTDGTELDIGKNRRKEIMELIKGCQQGRRLC